jgi:ureidoglycolate hydrolase
MNKENSAVYSENYWEHKMHCVGENKEFFVLNLEALKG